MIEDFLLLFSLQLIVLKTKKYSNYIQRCNLFAFKFSTFYKICYKYLNQIKIMYF
jgi:hypothetical protein